MPRHEYDSGDEFRHSDTGKPPVHLVPSEAIIAIAEVLAYGIEKYELGDPLPHAQNWMQAASLVDQARLKASLLRHVYADLRGEHTDPESGLRHLAHAAANICFLLWHTRGPSVDGHVLRPCREEAAHASR